MKHLIDRVLAEEFGAADLEFAWDADRDADPAQTATIATDYVEARIFINCMGETMKARSAREFPSRMGAELYEVDRVISALAAALR